MTTNADGDRRALDDLRARILTVDGQMAQLMAQTAQLVAQRQELVDAYEGHRAAIVGRMGLAPPGSLPASLPGSQPAQVPAAAPPERPEWSGARVRALLLWLGAALLAVSAVTFTAVAWSRLGDLGRALLLLAGTASTGALAVAARRRLPMTAEAFTGLTIALALVDVFAVRRAGLGTGLSQPASWALGTAAVAAFAEALSRAAGRRTGRFAVAALLPMPPVLLLFTIDGLPTWSMSMLFAGLAAAIAYGSTRWGGRCYQEGRVVLGLHAFGSWIVAALLAATAAESAVTVAAALGPALAVASLAVAPEIAWRASADRVLAVIAGIAPHGAPAAVLLTLIRPAVTSDGTMGVSVALGGLTILGAAALPTARRLPALVAGAAFALPGMLWAFAVNASAVLDPMAWLSYPWSGTVGLAARTAIGGPGIASTYRGSWPAVGALLVVAAVAVVLARRWPLTGSTGLTGAAGSRLGIGVAAAAIAVVAASAPLAAGSSVLVTLMATTSTFAVLLIGSAMGERREDGWGWALLPGALIAALPTLGWAAVSAGASVITCAAAAAAATAAALLVRTVQLRPGYAALAALLGVAFVGVAARAAGAPEEARGFSVVVAAAAVTLIAAIALGGEPAIRRALEYAGAAAALVGLLMSRDSAPWSAGSLTVMTAAAAGAALRPDRRAVYGPAAGVLALLAVWTWLIAADVQIVEAFTAPAAAVALAAGIAQWRNAPGRSWRALSPALVLAIGPTLMLGLGNDDAVRQIIAAALCLVTVLVGAALRLQAPLLLGALGLAVLGIDQWGDDLVRLPRWITLGSVGVVLMWIGATFEHRRRDWERASDVIGHFG